VPFFAHPRQSEIAGSANNARMVEQQFSAHQHNHSAGLPHRTCCQLRLGVDLLTNARRTEFCGLPKDRGQAELWKFAKGVLALRSTHDQVS
jgi:hypothetical protein